MKNTSCMRCICLIASNLAVVLPSAKAGTLYWDGSPTQTANADGGTGPWDNGTTSNWDTAPFGGSASVWTNTNNDTAVFGGGGTANRTVTLGEDITVGGLQFDARTYTIDTSGNTLTLGAANNTLLFGGNKDTTSAVITGAITGAGNFILDQRVYPLNSMLTLNSTGDGWSGSTTVNAGTILLVGQTSTALTNTSSITINGGTIRLDRVNDAIAGAQVSDTAAITFKGGGTIQLRHNTAISGKTEDIGPVTIASGQTNFDLNNATSSGGNAFILSSLTRSIHTASVTYAYNGNILFKVNGASDTAGGEIIGPWATIGSNANTQTDYAVYAGGDGTLAPASIAGSAQGTWSTVHAATSNYTLDHASGTVSDGVLTAARNVNTLRNATVAASAAANSTTEYFTLAGNTFANGDLITVSGTGGTIAGTPYFVINAGGAGADTFQISTSPGGGAVNLSNTTVGQISGGLNLNGFNLGTFGILNGTANASSGFAIAGSGSVTLPTASSGNLFVTTSASAMTIDSVIADNGAGVLTLVKNGSNTLTLSGANTYTGDLVVNAGTVAFSNLGALGPSGKNVTFAGSGTITSSFSTEYTGGVLTVNEGAVGTIGRSMRLTFSSTTGSGDLIYQGTGNASIGLTLGDASGFTGDVRVDVSSGTNPRPVVYFSAIGDAPGSALQSGGGQGDSNQETFFRYQGTSPLTFDHRRIEFLPLSGGNNAPRNLYLENNSADAAHTWVINTDVVNNNDRTNNLGTLYLGGTNTGNNELAGTYGDSTYNNQVFNLSKTGSGKWIVSSDNTFTGAVSVNAGTLALSGTNQYTGLTSVTGGGTLSVNSVSDYGVASAIGTAASGAIALGTGSNQTGTLEYTGSGHSSNRQIQIGSIGSASGNAVILNNGTTGALTFTATTFNVSDPTTGGSSGNRNLTLGGSYTGGINEIQGDIVANAEASRDVAIIKTGASSWKLSGTSSYTKTTVVQEGNLIAGSNSPNGGSGAFGNASSEITLGVAGGSNDAGILIGGAFNVGRSIRLLTSNNSDAGTRVLTLGGNTAANSEFSGDIILGTTNQAGRGMTLTAATGGQVTFSGIIQNPAGMDATSYTVTKSGAGTVVLSNSNTYTGSTAVTAGTLRVNNSSGSGTGTGLVTVSAGATLGGSGAIAGSVTIQNGGTLAAGNSIESLVVGGLTLAADSIFEHEMGDTTGTGADLVHSSGDLNFAGAVTLDLIDTGSHVWLPNDKITLLSYAGTLTLDVGAGFSHQSTLLGDEDTFNYDGATWVMNYDDALKGSNYTADAIGTSFVTMTVVVPEAGTAGLVLLGLLLRTLGRRNWKG